VQAAQAYNGAGPLYIQFTTARTVSTPDRPGHQEIEGDAQIEDDNETQLTTIMYIQRPRHGGSLEHTRQDKYVLEASTPLPLSIYLSQGQLLSG